MNWQMIDLVVLETVKCIIGIWFIIVFKGVAKSLKEIINERKKH